jgi:hypothetical protein
VALTGMRVVTQDLVFSLTPSSYVPKQLNSKAFVVPSNNLTETTARLRKFIIHNRHAFDSTGVPPYPLIQYLLFQLSAVYRGPEKKNWKIKEISSS